MATKNRIIRVGDKVKIIDARYVDRVGYPQTTENYRQLASDKFGKQIAEEFNDPIARAKLIESIAYQYLRASAFGGRKRSIHFSEDVQLLHRLAIVAKIRTAKTGLYVHATTRECYSMFEPAYLQVEETHRLATVASVDMPGNWIFCNEFPVSHLQLIEE